MRSPMKGMLPGGGHPRSGLDRGNAEQQMALLYKLVDIAAEISDGHVTIMKFTTHWRVGFFTPGDRFDIDGLCEGNTFEEAAERAIKERPTWGSVAEKIEQRKREYFDSILGAP